MINTRSAFFLAACLPLAACVVSPLSRTATESSKPVTLKGYTGVAGQVVTLQAVDQNTGSLVNLGSVPAAMSGTAYKTANGKDYSLYPWTFDAGVLAPNFWSPQTVVPDVATAQGRLEIIASVGGSNLYTFSAPAAQSAVNSHQDPLTSGSQFSDGRATVLFDQTGVGSGPGSPWTSVAGMISDSHSPYYSPVAWSVGYYTVEGGKKIYGLICTPTTGGPYPVVIYNHGGTDGTNGGNVSGVVTAAGWTAQPGAPDGLGQCISWAKRGWVFATSSYRGQNVNITSSSADFATHTWVSDGAVEFCMGEVTDVMALTDLLAKHASAISVGSAKQQVPLKVDGKILMYGYSHGGCITHRAVQQGAPVTAYSVIEGFSDLRLGYLTARSLGANPVLAAIASGAFQPGVSTYQPDAAGVMGYNWRSAHYFATRGDLSIQRFKTMPILILHGDVDGTAAEPNPTPLNQAATIAGDIGATNIFVGPNGVAAPSSYACVDGPAGAPLPAALAAPNKSCPISFALMNTGDPCVANGLPFPGLCNVLMLPLAPPAGQPQQLHYFVVYHNMNHINGGLAIKYTFNRFAEQNFSRQPGCDGLQPNCASE